MSQPSSPKNAAKFAWRELASQGLPTRTAQDRVHDFLEIYGLYNEGAAREQASRCIQCPSPTCVSGCPLCNPIPQWMQLTAEGRFLEAAAVLGSATNLAEVCSRLCPSDHLCEHQCILDGVSEPVAINALEQFLIEYAFAHGQVSKATAPPNGFKVAVIGSGPGGLTCAEELARQGCSVTVFDGDLVPGGLLVNGVPAFKVEQSIVQRRVDLLQAMGVNFRLGQKLGTDLPLTRLRSEHHAVYLGFDSRKSHPLDIPGSNLAGIIQALPFLLQKTTSVPLDLPHVDVAGKRVVVIGGGDTAMDCLRAALRWGASKAIGVYRRDQADMPCTRQACASAVEEGAELVFCAVPVEVLGKPDGTVRALGLARTEMGDLDTIGRRAFKVRPNTGFEVEADWIVPALGFDPLPCTHADDFAALAINDWGGIVVDDRGMTNLPGVFASGDIVRGPALVLNTVRDARRAAQSIHAWLTANAKPH